jgi:hypothetical protein
MVAHELRELARDEIKLENVTLGRGAFGTVTKVHASVLAVMWPHADVSQRERHKRQLRECYEANRWR